MKLFGLVGGNEKASLADESMRFKARIVQDKVLVFAGAFLAITTRFC